MAKKDERPPYGTAAIPTGEKKYNIIRWGWNGLNRTDDIDTGQLTDAAGVICDPPADVHPNKAPKLWLDFADGVPYDVTVPSYEQDSEYIRRENSIPYSIYGFDDQLIMLWEYNTDEPGYNINVQNATKYKYYFNHPPELQDTRVLTFGLEATVPSQAEKPHKIIQFNVVDMQVDPDTGEPSGNIVEYTYDRKFLIYPNCYSISYDFSGQQRQDFNPLETNPRSSFATVYGSRVFGATENAVFSSAYNSYVNYDLDTADDISSAHAWWSMSQSNTDAHGAVTALCTFDNHVVIFRKDFMQLVYNDKNPFRIVDVGQYGCDNDKAWTILKGVLYFASAQKVYAFTGGTPKEISKKLEAGDLSGAVLGSYKDTVWMQTKDTLYIYKDGVWSDLGTPGDVGKVVQFATLDYGLVGLVKKTVEGEDKYALWYFDWDVEAMDPAPYDPDEWEPDYSDSDWFFETDLMALGRLDVRRVKKFSALTQGKDGSEMSVFLLPDGMKIHLDPANITDEDRAVLAPYLVAEVSYEDEDYHVVRVLTRQFSSTMHRLLFLGHGYVRIFAAEIKISWGGELYVTK